ncbi:hypothetical protein K8S19_04980 [bacterium]|nr:hypothetical protein [bacterium]
MNNQNKIKINVIHLLLTVLIPLGATLIFDFGNRLFTNVWEYFHFLTGALGLFFFYIPTKTLLFILLTVMSRLLIAYLFVKISYKNLKTEYLMYIVHSIISVLTVFVGYYIMLIARL